MLVLLIASYAGLRLTDSALSALNKHLDDKDWARKLRPRDCGALGTLALTDAELKELREKTSKAREAHTLLKWTTT